MPRSSPDLSREPDFIEPPEEGDVKIWYPAGDSPGRVLATGGRSSNSYGAYAAVEAAQRIRDKTGGLFDFLGLQPHLVRGRWPRTRWEAELEYPDSRQLIGRIAALNTILPPGHRLPTLEPTNGQYTPREYAEARKRGVHPIADGGYYASHEMLYHIAHILALSVAADRAHAERANRLPEGDEQAIVGYAHDSDIMLTYLGGRQGGGYRDRLNVNWLTASRLALADTHHLSVLAGIGPEQYASLSPDNPEAPQAIA